MNLSAHILAQAAYAAGDRQRQERTDDLHRLQLLKELDEATFEVTDWEARFIADLLQRAARQPCPSFSEGQREKIEELRQSYGPRLAGGETRAPLPDPESGKCCWLVIEDGRQRRCNCDARRTGHKGMALCNDHFERQAEALRLAKGRRCKRSKQKAES